MNLFQKIIVLLTLSGINISHCIGAEYENLNGINSREAISNLKLNEVRYYLFQQDYLAALSLEKSSLATNPLLQNKSVWLEAELNLSFGLFEQIDKIFRQLTSDISITGTPNQLWIKFAQHYYKQPDYTKAQLALSKVSKKITDDQRQDINILHTNILIAKDQLENAYSKINSTRKKDALWKFYARYNMAVTLINIGRNKEGIAILNELVNTETNIQDIYYNEITRIIDRANLNLGYQLIDDKKLNSAKDHFLKVSNSQLDYSLHGIGWTNTKLGQERQALEAWLKLQQGDISSPTVQESYLAAPYALDRLDAKQQSLLGFKKAITRYGKEVKHIDSLINLIRSGNLMAVNSMHIQSNNNNEWPASTLNIEDSYIKILYTNDQFLQLANKNQQLIALLRTLETQITDIKAFQSHINNRILLFKKRLPKVLNSSYRESTIKLSVHQQYQNELTLIESKEDALALITESEKHNTEILDLLSVNISDLSKLFNLGRLDDKLSIYRGIILWDITMEYDSRLKEYTTSLADIKNDINKLSKYRKKLLALKQTAFENLDVLDDQLKAIESQAKLLRSTTIELKRNLNKIMDDTAVATLEYQKTRIENYRKQAYLAIAQLYEEAYVSYQQDVNR